MPSVLFVLPLCCHSFYFVTLSVSLCYCLDCHYCACVHTSLLSVHIFCIHNLYVYVCMGLNLHACVYLCVFGMFPAPLIVSLEKQTPAITLSTAAGTHLHQNNTTGAHLRTRVCIHHTFTQAHITRNTKTHPYCMNTFVSQFYSQFPNFIDQEKKPI